MIATSSYAIGNGPAATITAYVPDLHFFNGRGGKDIIPLYRDRDGTPNVDAKLLFAVTQQHKARDADAVGVTAERLFAYSFGVLGGTDYTERFHEALTSPGPRVPLTADPALFLRMASHGERLVWLQTFGERFGRGALPTEGVKWKTEPTRLPDAKSEVVFDQSTGSLRVADGVLVGIPEAVWRFAVSGMDVIPKWLGYRRAKPAGRAASSDSPLDQIRPTTWPAEWSNELVEIVSAIKGTLAMTPDGVALLDEILAGPLLSAQELPSVPMALRKPPTTTGTGGDDPTLFEEDE